MPEYSITFARSARKELENLPSNVAERVLDRIEALALQPRPPGCAKLKGQKDIWRIRVVYVIDDANQAIDVSVIRHRKDAYRDY